MLSELVAATLERGAATTLHRQVYESIRQLILAGTLKAGQRLPASRELAADLAVGRNTVIDAYAQLTAEGYLQGRVGAGTFVSAAFPERQLPARDTAQLQKTANRRHRLSARAQAVLDEPAIMQGGAFAPCVPDITLFPFTTWQRLLSRSWRAARTRDTHYALPGGHPDLRAAIAEHVQIARQVRCEADQVIVVNGAQHGLDLCARLLADAGERVWVEDPGYPGARRTFLAAGLDMVPIDVDAEGMAPVTTDWARPPQLIYITPSHQFPLGTVMSLSRRRDLLNRAARHSSWIIEDDYDGEFRFSGRPIASLQGIDQAGRVIYMGTFSKTLYPGLRLGYLIVPASICESFALAAAQLSFEGRQVTQAALAAFMREGHFGSHIRRMRMVYAARCELLTGIWQRELGDASALSGTDTGMHVVAELPRGKDRLLSDQAGAAGIIAQSLQSFYLGRAKRAGLVLGYGAVHEKDIERHGRALARIIARELR